MEKHKLILVSLIAGIAEAILLFVFFSFGAIIGSHLRFYGYRRSSLKNHPIINRNPLYMNLHSQSVDVAQIKSINNGKLAVMNINKIDSTFNLSNAKVISFIGSKENKNILKSGDYILIRRIKKNLIIRIL